MIGLKNKIKILVKFHQQLFTILRRTRYNVNGKRARQYLPVGSKPLFVGQNFRIQFSVVQNEDLHQKSYWQPFLDPKQVFFYLLEPLEVPHRDKMSKVNVKIEALPENFFGK